MFPVIAIVGRPNVGKSTLFNRLTQSRNALVAEVAGLTRDRQYGEAQIQGRACIVIDTGGLLHGDSALDELVTGQAEQAIAEADILLLVVDARQGLQPDDEVIAKQLRATAKPCYLVLNKIDGLDEDIVSGEFYRLGIKSLYAISASHGRGMEELTTELCRVLPAIDETETTPTADAIHIAIVGRPNVGKSTLVNRMLGEERMITYDEPGSTRDSIYVPLTYRDKNYVLIDTAGIRRKYKGGEAVEHFSVAKSLQAIKMAHVVIMVLDAKTNVVDQDLSLLGFILQVGKGLIITINKWDGLPHEQKDAVKRELDRRLSFVDFVKPSMISALHGTGVGDLFAQINKVYASAMQPLSTAIVNRILQQAIADHQPPLVHGRRIKLRYAHAGGTNPPTIVIHGNQTADLPQSYVRYLENTYRKALKVVGSPVKIELRTGENPYAGRKNTLTPRQQQKRKRLIRFIKRKK